MHTQHVWIPDYGPVTINANSDYSGDASIVWSEHGVQREVRIPAELLIRLQEEVARIWVRNQVIAFLETLA